MFQHTTPPVPARTQHRTPERPHFSSLNQSEKEDPSPVTALAASLAHSKQKSSKIGTSSTTFTWNKQEHHLVKNIKKILWTWTKLSWKLLLVCWSCVFRGERDYCDLWHRGFDILTTATMVESVLSYMFGEKLLRKGNLLVFWTSLALNLCWRWFVLLTAILPVRSWVVNCVGWWLVKVAWGIVER